MKHDLSQYETIEDLKSLKERIDNVIARRKEDAELIFTNEVIADARRRDITLDALIWRLLKYRFTSSRKAFAWLRKQSVWR